MGRACDEMGRAKCRLGVMTA
eukprot:SAG31_NODE_40343_length_281_cov_0.857143_2_plen_20_part_01